MSILKIRADRDILYGVGRASSTDGALRNSYVWTNYRAEVAHELPLDLVGRLYAARQGARFLLPFTLDNRAISRTDRVWSLGGSLSRRLRNSVRLGLQAGWEERASPVEEASYSRIVYGITAEYLR